MHKEKPYHDTVLSILQSTQAKRVLDAPCGHGWLGRALQKRANIELIDGLGLWEFPDADDGYRAVWEHNLDQVLPGHLRDYDAVVCGEAIHLITNPGLLLESFAKCLRPGGQVIITTPNTWYLRSRLQFLLRGFHSGFSPMVGKRRGEYVTYFPWSFPQLHLLLSHCGFDNIQIHEVAEPKPKRAIEHLLAVPSRLYFSHRLRRVDTTEEADFWRQAASAQSIHGRWLVVSACTNASTCGETLTQQEMAST